MRKIHVPFKFYLIIYIVVLYIVALNQNYTFNNVLALILFWKLGQIYKEGLGVVELVMKFFSKKLH